jgi:MoaA/NifB/PqqE/SkfB family radical SAM enzyme
MIEGTMDALKPADYTQFRSILDEQQSTKRWDGLILTGAEITLNKNLPEMAILARQHGFNYVRIQTHGMHLGKEAYLNKLLDAGINEFFISVAGASQESHDAITKVPGSFRKMMRGIEMIEKCGEAVILTNTVVTRESYKEINKIIDMLANYKKTVQHEFWNFFPMDHNDSKNLIVSYPELMPYIQKAISAADRHDKAIEFKNIPECLLGQHKSKLVNEQPSLFIDPNFWTEFDKNNFNQCIYREKCRSTKCLGLTDAYVKKFGFEGDFVSPL